MPDERVTLRKLAISDIIDACGAGIRDFVAAPKFGLAIAGIFVAAGWLLLALLLKLKLIYLVYPTAMGFALIAPFAAVGFYAVSDRLEKGAPLTWSAIVSAVWDAMQRDLRWMAVVTGFIFFFWMDIAAILFFTMMGLESLGPNFLTLLFTTPSGLIFLLIGNLAGAFIAISLFSIAVLSIPMLYDRDTDFVTAMTTSVRYVTQNPVPMLFWCALIGIVTVLSIASAFLGLFITLPIIGHATWHLYRQAITPE